MQFQLITPEAILFSGDATQVNLPGSEGVFGVLDGHAPLVSTLSAGLVTVESEDGNKHIVILSGLAEVTPEKTVVLAETAEDFSGVSASEAASKLAEATKNLGDAIKEEEKKHAERRVLIAQTLVDGLKVA